jgi:tetratricopeptide (TPR) repeat protein
MPRLAWNVLLLLLIACPALSWAAARADEGEQAGSAAPADDDTAAHDEEQVDPDDPPQGQHEDAAPSGDLGRQLAEDVEQEPVEEVEQGEQEPVEEAEQEPAEVVEQPPAEDAEPGAAGDAAPQPAAERMLSLLVLDTLDRASAPQRAAELTGLLIKALMQFEQVEVLGPEGLLRLRRSRPTAVEAALRRAELQQRQAQEQLLELALDEAVDGFQTARVIYRRHLAWMQDPEPLIAALMGLAEALATAGRHEESRLAYREVLALNPDYEPDPGQVPSKLRNRFEQVRAEMAELPTGVLEVAVEPEVARVVLDGLTAGRSPLRREGIHGGLHMVRIQAEGYRSHRQALQIEPGRTSRIEIALERSDLPRRIEQLRAALASGAARERVVALAAATVRAAEVAAVVVARLVRVPDRDEPIWSAAAVPAAGEPAVVAAHLPAGELGPVVGALAWQLVEALEQGTRPVPPPASLGLVFDDRLLGRPRPLAAPKVVQLPAAGAGEPEDEVYPGPPQTEPAGPAAAAGGGAVAPAEPFWQRWWFWTAVGAVVAGGVATGLALTLQPDTETIHEPDSIRIRVLRNAGP